MKKILNIIVVAVLAMVSFTSCDKGLVTEMEAEGKVSLKGLVVSVLNNEDEIESRSASVDVKNYKVEIVNKLTGETAGAWTYSSLPELVTLAVGDYTVNVYNQALQNAAWEAPYYFGAQDFTVKENDITLVETVVCRLSNLKVSIKYSDELQAVMGEDVVVNVLVGEDCSLDFTYGETRAGYFRCDSENKSLVATFSGTVDGYYVSEYKVISDVAAGQHRIITFSLKQAPDIMDETGLIGTTGLSLDASVTTEDLTIDIPAEEETIQPDDFIALSAEELNFTMGASSKNVDVNASAAWTASSNADWCTVTASSAAGESTLKVSVSANTVESVRNAVVTVVMGEVTKEIAVSQEAYSEAPAAAAPTITSATINLNAVNTVTATSVVDVDVKAEGKIAKFNVKINMSDGNGGILDLGSVGLANSFDLCAPGAYKTGLEGLGLPVEDAVKGKTEMKFDISGFMSLLVIYSGDHNFEIEVVDELGQSVSATLKLKVD